MSGSAIDAQQDEIQQSVLDGAKAMSGHMVYGAHRHTRHPFRYIAMVREPVDRVISDYYYVQRTPDHDFYDPVVTQNYSLEDYVTSQITIYTDNVQTRMLAGIGTDVAVGDCTETHLEQALQHVESDFAVVGLTERFDESIILMKQHLGWSFPVYQTRNKTRNRPARRDVNAATREVIRTHNVLDVQLYDDLQTRFDAQITEGGSHVRRHLARLQRLNRLYSPAMRAYIYARSTINDVLGRERW